MTATKIRWALSDYRVMTVRSLRHTIRNYDALLTSVMLPVVMLLLFVYVFGGALQTGTDGGYVNYVVPGVILTCIGYCASITSVNINSDISKGIVDRFRSMAIVRGAFIIGHVVASVARNILSTGLVFGVAFLIGYHPAATPGGWITAILLLLCYTLAITYISVCFGLLANSPEGAGALGFVIMFLPYLGSGFAPTSTMPGPLRAFAENQPITVIIEALRGQLDGTGGGSLPAGFLWAGGITLVFAVLARLLYKRKVSK